MKQAHNENENYEPEESHIVVFTNAVVQPSAMVVKFFNTAVAFTAVLGSDRNVGFTHFASVGVVTKIEAL